MISSSCCAHNRQRDWLDITTTKISQTHTGFITSIYTSALPKCSGPQNGICSRYLVHSHSPQQEWQSHPQQESYWKCGLLEQISQSSTYHGSSHHWSNAINHYWLIRHTCWPVTNQIHNGQRLLQCYTTTTVPTAWSPITPPYPQSLPSNQMIQIPAPQLAAISQIISRWYWNHLPLPSSSILDHPIQHMHLPGQRNCNRIWQSKHGICKNLGQWVQHWWKSRSSSSAIHQQHCSTITSTLPRLRKAPHSLWSR